MSRRQHGDPDHCGSFIWMGRCLWAGTKLIKALIEPQRFRDLHIYKLQSMLRKYELDRSLCCWNNHRRRAMRGRQSCCVRPWFQCRVLIGQYTLTLCPIRPAAGCHRPISEWCHPHLTVTVYIHERVSKKLSGSQSWRFCRCLHIVQRHLYLWLTMYFSPVV